MFSVIFNTRPYGRFFVSAILAVFFFGASKMKYVSENTRQWVKAVLFSAMLGGIQTALAAGGLSTGESTVKQWFQEWYNILAVLAGVAIVKKNLLATFFGFADGFFCSDADRRWRQGLLKQQKALRSN